MLHKFTYRMSDQIVSFEQSLGKTVSFEQCSGETKRGKVKGKGRKGRRKRAGNLRKSELLQVRNKKENKKKTKTKKTLSSGKTYKKGKLKDLYKEKRESLQNQDHWLHFYCDKMWPNMKKWGWCCQGPGAKLVILLSKYSTGIMYHFDTKIILIPFSILKIWEKKLNCYAVISRIINPCFKQFQVLFYKRVNETNKQNSM